MDIDLGHLRERRRIVVGDTCCEVDEPVALCRVSREMVAKVRSSVSAPPSSTWKKHPSWKSSMPVRPRAELLLRETARI